MDRHWKAFVAAVVVVATGTLYPAVARATVLTIDNFNVTDSLYTYTTPNAWTPGQFATIHNGQANVLTNTATYSTAPTGNTVLGSTSAYLDHVITTPGTGASYGVSMGLNFSNQSPGGGPEVFATGGSESGTTSLIYDTTSANSGQAASGSIATNGLSGFDLTSGGTYSAANGGGILLEGLAQAGIGTDTVSVQLWSNNGANFNTVSFTIPSDFTTSTPGTVFIPFAWNFAGVNVASVGAIDVSATTAANTTVFLDSIVVGTFSSLTSPADDPYAGGPLMILTPEHGSLTIWTMGVLVVIAGSTRARSLRSRRVAELTV